MKKIAFIVNLILFIVASTAAQAKPYMVSRYLKDSDGVMKPHSIWVVSSKEDIETFVKDSPEFGLKGGYTFTHDGWIMWGNGFIVAPGPRFKSWTEGKLTIQEPFLLFSIKNEKWWGVIKERDPDFDPAGDWQRK